MKIGEVRLDPKSKKNNKLIKRKHKLFFHIKDTSDFYEKYGICISGIQIFYATMNGFTIRPDFWHYTISDIEHIHPSIKSTLKPFGSVENTPSCFGCIEDVDTVNRIKAYILSNAKFAEFIEYINSPSESIQNIYVDFQNIKVSGIFNDVCNIELLELP